MTVTIRELFDSEAFTSGPQAQLMVQYSVEGVTNPLSVLNEVRAATPLTFYDLVRRDIKCTPQGDGLWFADINYGLRKEPEDDVAEWSFSIDESSQHITHSLSTVDSYPSGAPDFKQAMNVTGDGADKVVEGADVGVTTFSWNETLYRQFRSVTPSYMRRLYVAQGCYNSTPFRVWAAGEVLLQRVTGTPFGESLVKLDFSFAVEPNVTGRTIGSITGIAKKGWDYLWVFCRLKEDTSADELCPQAEGVYVEQLRESYNFSYLGLPDPWA